jgi:hypothetical protein
MALGDADRAQRRDDIDTRVALATAAQAVAKASRGTVAQRLFDEYIQPLRDTGLPEDQAVARAVAEAE